MARYRFHVPVLCLLACFCLAAPGFAEPVYIPPVSIKGMVDMEALIALMRDGELALVESKEDGTFRQATVFAHVNAPPDVVWGVVTDYANFKDFMPAVDKIKVLEEDGNETVVQYKLEVPGPNIGYCVRYTHNPPDSIDIRLEHDKGAIKTGGWRFELYPLDDGKKNMLVYYLITDMREVSWIVDVLLKNHPVLEHGVNVATGMVTLRPFKERAEQLANGKCPLARGED